MLSFERRSLHLPSGMTLYTLCTKNYLLGKDGLVPSTPTRGGLCLRSNGAQTIYLQHATVKYDASKCPETKSSFGAPAKSWNKKLLVTSASLLVTSALLLRARKLLETRSISNVRKVMSSLCLPNGPNSESTSKELRSIPSSKAPLQWHLDQDRCVT